MRVALIYDDTVRPDTTGVHWGGRRLVQSRARGKGADAPLARSGGHGVRLVGGGDIRWDPGGDPQHDLRVGRPSRYLEPPPLPGGRV